MQRIPAYAKIDQMYRIADSGCWEWIGGKCSRGYGILWHVAKGKNVKAHRAMYELRVGPLVDGMTIDHLCRNHSCVNPAHLEQVTPKENTLRGVSFAAKNKAKTTCPRGHEYVIEHGRRQCRTCRIERLRERRQNPEYRAHAKAYFAEWYRKRRAA